MNRFFVLIGGGTGGRTISRLWRNQLPELAEYNDIARVAKNASLAGIPKENMTIHFADGNVSHTNIGVSAIGETIFHIDNYLRKSWLNKFVKFQKPALDNYEKYTSPYPVSPFDCTTKGANKEEIAATFDHIAKQNPDEVVIVGTSHGISYRGMVLYNEYFTLNALTIPFLKEQISKIPKSTKIKIVINSCYSGSYLELTDENVFVLTSSNFRKPSTYNIINGALSLQILSEHLFSSESVNNRLYSLIIPIHSLASLEDNNYRGYDSISYKLDLVMNRHLGISALDRFNSKMIGICAHPFSSYMYTFGIIGMVIVDPTGLVRRYYQCKLFAILGKTLGPMIKILLPIFLNDLFKKLLTKSKIYNEWYTFGTKRKIAKIDNGTDIRPELRDMYEYAKECADTTKEACTDSARRYSHYTLFDEKIRVFGQIANDDEIKSLNNFCDKFVIIAK